MNTFFLAEIQRAIINLCKIGTVVAVDAVNSRCRVDVDGLTTAWIKWSSSSGRVRQWRVLTVGEQVLLLSPAGDLAQAVVVCSIYSRQFSAPSADPDVDELVYDDGARLSYNQASQHLEATLPAGGSVRIVAPAGVTFDGDVLINGRLQTTGDTVADGISVVQHRHGGVQAGGSMTGVPA